MAGTSCIEESDCEYAKCEEYIYDRYGDYYDVYTYCYDGICYNANGGICSSPGVSSCSIVKYFHLH